MPDANGQICAPDAPGLGIEPDLAGIQPYLVDAEIRAGSKVLYKTPSLQRYVEVTQTLSRDLIL